MCLKANYYDSQKLLIYTQIFNDRQFSDTKLQYSYFLLIHNFITANIQLNHLNFNVTVI